MKVGRMRQKMIFYLLSNSPQKVFNNNLKRTIMNNEIAIREAIQNIDFKELDAMMNGCNEAVVILGINYFTRHLSKMVLAYDSKDVSFEEVVCGAGQIVKYSNFSITRAFVYKINKTKQVRHLEYIQFHSIYLKDMPGFIPGENTHDCRHKHKAV